MAFVLQSSVSKLGLNAAVSRKASRSHSARYGPGLVARVNWRYGLDFLDLFHAHCRIQCNAISNVGEVIAVKAQEASKFVATSLVAGALAAGVCVDSVFQQLVLHCHCTLFYFVLYVCSAYTHV